MLELGFGRTDSDGDQLSLETVNSSQSSMSSESCSSFSRLSFDTNAATPAPAIEAPVSTQEENNKNNNNLSLKPHRSSDFAYSAIQSATLGRKSGLTLRDFRLIRRIGAGDIGTVYLCKLSKSGAEAKEEEEEDEDSDHCFYAMKVVDREAVAVKKKVHRAEMEKKILKMLDHPFLPTLYAEFEASHFSCIVMEFCAGGDLHSLRHKQPHKRFSLNSARYISFLLFFLIKKVKKKKLDYDDCD